MGAKVCCVSVRRATKAETLEELVDSENRESGGERDEKVAIA